MKKIPQPTPPKQYPVDPELLRTLLIKDQAEGVLSNELAALFYVLVDNYSKSAQFVKNPLREDMVADAVLHITTNAWAKPDPNLGTSLFSYFTTCAHWCFLRVLEKENAQEAIKASFSS